MTDREEVPQGNKLITSIKSYVQNDKQSWVPILSMLISMISLQEISEKFFGNGNRLTLFHLYVLIILVTVHYGLHIGIKMENKKQFNAWYFMKFLEMLLVANVSYSLYFDRGHDGTYVIRGATLIIFNMILIGIIKTYIKKNRNVPVKV